VSLQRENCVHRFDSGFIPKICEDRDGIIVDAQLATDLCCQQDWPRKISHLGRFLHRRRREH
jgi:hypothetical protein